VSACINDFDPLVSCDNQHQCFHGDASYRALSSNVSYERTRRVFCGFFQTIDPLFDIHLLFDVMLFSKGLKHWETVFEIFYDTFLTVSSKFLSTELYCILTTNNLW